MTSVGGSVTSGEAPGRRARLQQVLTGDVGTAALSLALAVLLFTRFSIDRILTRDEAIYTYAGQQLLRGDVPYASIFDPKTPLASVLAWVGAALADLTGTDDVRAIRLVYFVLACLAVLAIYLLARELWDSRAAAVVTAVAFLSFRGFALDALTGPNAKTPGILLALLAMVLTARWCWLLAGLAAALAFLVWQPLLVYLACTGVLALVLPDRGARRSAVLRVAIGAGPPLALTAVWFAAWGKLHEFLVAAFVFPVTGIRRGGETLGARLQHIADVVRVDYEVSGYLFWAGSVLLLVVVVLALVRHRGGWRVTVTAPLVCVVLPTWVAVVLFSAADFQGYPDLYPLLPYPALGCGAVTAWALERFASQPARRAALAATAALVVAWCTVSWVSFSAPGEGPGLVEQQADGCTLNHVLGPRGVLQSLGDPRPLVVTHRRNPSRFVYLGSGIAEWHIQHLRDGLPGWYDEIRSSDPDVIISKAWTGPVRVRMTRWLRAHYTRATLGSWHLFLAPHVLTDAETAGVPVRPPRHPGGPVRLGALPSVPRC